MNMSGCPKPQFFCECSFGVNDTFKKYRKNCHQHQDFDNEKSNIKVLFVSSLKIYFSLNLYENPHVGPFEKKLKKRLRSIFRSLYNRTTSNVTIIDHLQPLISRFSSRSTLSRHLIGLKPLGFVSLNLKMWKKITAVACRFFRFSTAQNLQFQFIN